VVSAAEYTIGMLLALVRRYSRRARAAELVRKTIGMVGFGKVGSRVTTRLRALESELLVYDP
jgi:D-3-phosphoglycerate dehydrogenase